MKKLFLPLLLLLLPFLLGAAPSRENTYVSGDTILAADVTANEDAIFLYLQGGVDTYKALSITNAAVDTSANIQSPKLNLTSIAQAVAITSSGSFTNAGTTALSGAITITGNSTFSGTTIANLGTVTTAAFTTITDLGNVTTTGTFGLGGKLTAGATEIEGSNFDINGGTMDGVQIAGATATGAIFYNDASDDAVALTAGAAKTVLTSNGTTSAPSYQVLPFTFVSQTTVDDGTNSGDISISDDSIYMVIFTLANEDNSDNSIELRFNSDSGNVYETSFDGTVDALRLFVLEQDSGSNAQTSMGKLIITTVQNGIREATVTGDVFYINASGAVTADAIGGTYNNTTVSSFEILGDQNFDATITVYLLSQS